MDDHRSSSDLSPKRIAALGGLMALCCLVPMLVVFGAVSLGTAVVGGGAALVLATVVGAAWMVWMGRRHAGHSGGACCGGQAQGHDHAERAA